MGPRSRAAELARLRLAAARWPKVAPRGHRAAGEPAAALKSGARAGERANGRLPGSPEARAWPEGRGGGTSRRLGVGKGF